MMCDGVSSNGQGDLTSWQKGDVGDGRRGLFEMVGCNLVTPHVELDGPRDQPIGVLGALMSFDVFEGDSGIQSVEDCKNLHFDIYLREEVTTRGV
jgi:hypothetical protein